MATFSVPQLVKQQVPKSRFNLSCARRSPINIGVAIPIYHKLILPGDDFRIKDVSAKIKSLPFVNSLMGSFRLQLDWFFEPFTNLYGFMDNNETLSTKDIVQMPLWTYSTAPSSIRGSSVDSEGTSTYVDNYWYYKSFSLLPDYESYLSFVSDCSLMNFLGFPARWAAHRMKYKTTVVSSGLVSSEMPFDFGAYLGYWDIYRTFYTNKQLKYGAVFSSWYNPYAGNPDGNSMTSASWSYYNTHAYQISQDKFDKFFKALRSNTPFNLSHLTASSDSDIVAFMSAMKPFLTGALDRSGTDPLGSQYLPILYANPFCGLGLVQYRPDLFRSIILPSTPTMVASANVTTIDALRIASHLQRLYDLYDASGGQFAKWYEMQFDVDINGNVDRPILLNTSHQYIVVDDVTATALTGSADNPETAVGEQFGKINQNTGFRGVRFRSKYHGYLYAIVTLVPEVDYSNTFNPLMFNSKFGDIYTPAMAQLGYENVPFGLYCACAPVTNPYTESYSVATGTGAGQGLIPTYGADYIYDWSASGNSTDVMSSVGRNVHWYAYMTDFNMNFGAFSMDGTLSGWSLNRSFLRQLIGRGEVSSENVTYLDFDMNMYVVPTDWNYFFAYQQEDNQSWYLQLGFDIEATRPIPKYMLGKIV